MTSMITLVNLSWDHGNTKLYIKSNDWKLEQPILLDQMLIFYGTNVYESPLLQKRKQVKQRKEINSINSKAKKRHQTYH